MFAHPAYINHLMAMARSATVTAIDNIFADQGDLLISKDAQLSESQLLTLVETQLQRPIFQSVCLDNELSADIVLQDITEYLQADPSLKVLSGIYFDKKILSVCCSLLCRFPVLRQQLTLLKHQLPGVYQQAIFCSWLGTVIYQLSEKPGPDIGSIFITGMCHDIGMLHVDPKILCAQKQLTMEEWGEVQRHPQIGHDILGEINGLPKGIASAVMDHHEQPDGTGYPAGKLAKDMSEAGQLMQLLDSVHAMYRKHQTQSFRTLGDLIPIIQVNINSRFDQTGNKLISILKNCATSVASVPNEHVPAFVDTVKSSILYTMVCTQLLNAFSKSFGFTHGHKGVHAIQNSIFHIASTMERSGIVNEAYARFLDQVLEETLDYAYREVEDAYLMVKEVLYHIEKLKRLIWQIADANKDNDVGMKLAQLLMSVDDIPPPPISDTISNLWIVNY